jgi:ABC-type polysaccharide/polyol phosphate transport system ATPase subunit
MSDHKIQSQIAISVKNLSKQFSIPHEKISSIKIAFINLFKKNNSETFYALKDVSFEVKKGEFFGILGRNGSGKSTLLKILAGVYTADKGHIHLNGLVSPFLELGIGFNPELSGRDNIYLNATVLGLTEREIDEKFDSIVAFSELERFIDQKIKNYSSGMQVRLAFAVSIHANREILLMDEVLAVGDSNFQSKCLREFAKYKEQGKTVILVTHDIGTVQRYCDRAMLLRNGEIAMIGSAEEVGNEYIYQNMSDEEKRIIKEQEQAKIKAEKDMAQAQIEAEKLKGKALEEEKSRLEAEKLRQAEEQKRLEEERKNKVAEITGVEFLDRDGKVKNTFASGEDIFVAVNFKKFQKNKESFDVRISVETEDGCYLFGYDTFSDKFRINNEKVILKITKNSFLQGKFFVNVSCYGNNWTRHLDFKPRVCSFNIFSLFDMAQYKGILNVEHLWK